MLLRIEFYVTAYVQTIVVRTDDKPWFHNLCVLAHCGKQRVYRMWSRCRAQADWKEFRLACLHAQFVYEDTERVFTEQSKALLTKAPNSRK